MSRAVATLILNLGKCNHATSSSVIIRARPLLNLLGKSRNTRSILAFNAKYFLRELQAASTLPSAVSSDRGVKAFFRPATATEVSTSSSSQNQAYRARASRNFFSSTLDPSKNSSRQTRENVLLLQLGHKQTIPFHRPFLVALLESQLVVCVQAWKILGSCCRTTRLYSGGFLECSKTNDFKLSVTSLCSPHLPPVLRCAILQARAPLKLLPGVFCPLFDAGVPA